MLHTRDWAAVLLQNGISPLTLRKQSRPVLLCRPTMSKSLHLKMIGRALRLSPETGK